MRLLPFLVLTLALGPAWALLAPVASAQQTEFSLSVGGSDGVVVSGSSINATVSVRNDGTLPITVALGAVGPASVQFSVAQLTVLPTQTETARATIWGNGTHADPTLTFFARETTSGTNRTAAFALHVRTFAFAAQTPLVGTVPGQAGFTALDVTTSYPETVTLSVPSPPPGWSARFDAASLALAANETARTQVHLTPPGDASAGRYRVDVRANTSRGATRDLTLDVDVHRVTVPSLRATYVALATRVEPGANATADVHVQSNVTDTVDFLVYAMPSGWTTTIVNMSAGVTPTTNATTRVVVKVPANATPGVYGVNVSATLRGSGAVAYAKFPVEVVPGGASAQVFTLRLSPLPLEATPGSAVMVFPTMFNAGVETDAMDFAVSGDLNVTKVPSPGRGEVRVLRVQAPSAPGTYRATITTTSSNGGTASAEVVLEVRPFALSVASNDWTMAAGAASRFGVALNSTTPRSVTLSADPIPGWVVSVAPANATVSPGATSGAHVLLEPPAGASGRHAVTVRARDTATGEERAVTHTVYVGAARDEPGAEIAPLVSPSRIDATIARGANDTYHIAIRNPNADARAYELGVQLPPGWWTWNYPQTITVQGNATYGHQLYVRAEANATDGAGTFTVRGASVGTSIPIDLRVAGQPPAPGDRLWISPRDLQLPFFEGENATRSVLLQAGNNASTAIAYNVTLSVPDGWEASVRPQSGTLLPGGRTSLNVSVTHRGGARAELGVKISDHVQGDVSWIDLVPPGARPPTPVPTPPPTPSPVEPNDTPRRLVPAEIVLTAGGSATATFHSDTEAGPLRLVLPATLSADALVLFMVPDPDGGWSATFVLSASASAEAGPVTGARIEGLSQPFAIPVRIVSGVVPAAKLEDPADSAASTALIVAGSAAAVGGGALGVLWANKRWPALFAALYTRLAPSQVLQHPVRRRMTEAIAAEPGVAVGELQKKLGLSNGVMAHHLHRLEKTGAVVSMMDGQWRRLYPVGLKPGTGGTLPQRALRALEGRGAVSATDLATELGVSRQALHYHLKKLAQEGRIKATVAGGVLKVELAAASA